MPAKRVVHVMFDSSGAGSLRKALAEANRPEKVVCSDDDFCLGPIDLGPIDSASGAAGRAQWMNAQLGVDDWQLVVAGNTRLRAASIAADVLPVVWFSRRDAHSYAGFLWWLSHLGEGPCDIVDVTETLVPGHMAGDELEPPRLAVSPSLLPDAEIIAVRETARPLQQAERQAHLRLWQQLVQENAPLRVIEGTTLISVPITYFDPLLLSFVIEHWRKMTRVVGSALMQFSDENIHQTGDLLLFARVRALAEAGIIESVGNLTKPRFCKVRLPQKRS